MAVGDGGFKQVPFGFDKNEVNEYISELRKKMSANDAEMKANDAKAKEALKLAEEADERIKKAVGEVQAKLDEANAQLDEEKRRSDDLKSQVDSLKKKLEDEKKKMSDMLRSGEGVSAKAKEAYTEILDKANADADEIIKKAQASAEDILAEAQASKQTITDNLDKFLAAVREQSELLTESYSSVAKSASELLGTEISAPAIEPIPAAAAASSAAVASAAETVETAEEPAPKPAAEEKKPEPKVEEKPEPKVEEKPEPKVEKKPEPKVEKKPEPKVENKPEPEADKMPEAKAKKKPEIKPMVSAPAATDNANDMPVAKAEPKPADFESDIWGGSEIAAQNIYSQQQDNGGVPLVNPDAQTNPFGDLFMNDTTDDMSDTIDMSGFIQQESAPNTTTEVAPLDVSEHAEVSMNSDFTKDLISQTMHSGAVDSIDEDLMSALKAAEEAFAVQPSEGNTGDVVNAADVAMENAVEEEDDLMKALREAEEALSGLNDESTAAIEEAEQAAAQAVEEDDPWADLQRQLAAIEQDGGLSADESIESAQPEPQVQESNVTDDSSMWDFGSTDSSSSDDDMSSDAFGGFGGF